MATIEVIDAQLEVLDWEALPTLTTSTALFPNIPEGTEVILFTVRNQAITVSLVGPGKSSRRNKPGIAATAAANGIDFGVNSTTAPYRWPFTIAHARKAVAIQQAVAATGFVYYCKRVSP